MQGYCNFFSTNKYELQPHVWYTKDVFLNYEGEFQTMNKMYIIDRIEEDYIVIESPEGNIINVKKEFLKGKAKEGDCLIKEDNYFIIDIEDTEKRQIEIANKLKGMWN